MERQSEGQDEFDVSSSNGSKQDIIFKEKYEGESLTHVGRDGNDQMLSLTYVVVEVENKKTWTWFLEQLIDNLGGLHYVQDVHLIQTNKSMTLYPWL